MRNIAQIIFVSVFLTISFIGINVANAADAPNGSPQSFSDLAEGLLPAVVNISSVHNMDEGRANLPEFPEFPEGSPFEEFFEEFMDRRERISPDQPQSSLGSGFVIDAKNGYIVTNNHVIKDADEIRVTFHNDKTLKAEVIGHDEKTDLALLKVDPKEIALVEVSFGNSDKSRVGDWILAIGNPFGLGGTVTAGIISARQRNINAGPYDDFLQTDASINRGNSGGPMFNLDGEVIGINTAIFSPTGGSVGIGFAIPSNLAIPVVKQLKEFGRTRRGWLGVRIQSVTDEIAESLGMEDVKGALVAAITPDGPADKGKIQVGDVIIQFNGKAIRQMRHLPRIVAETDIGDKAKVTVWRNGNEITTTVEIGELEKAEETGIIDDGKPDEEDLSNEGVLLGNLGITIVTIDEAIRDEYSISKSKYGVFVMEVEENSEAESQGLKKGDIILKINQQEVANVEKALMLVKRAVKSSRKQILLLVDHGAKGNVRFVALKLNRD